jgi:cytochrome c oxidase cbb3-type subunit 3
MFASLRALFLLVLAFCVVPGAHASVHGDANAPFIVVKATGKTMDEAVADLKRSIADHNYVFIRQQALDMGLVSDASEDKDILIVYFCNFGMLDSSLKVDKHVGVYLPCRVTLIREADGVRMVVMNPKFVGHALGDKNLKEICERLTADYTEILNEATL